MSPPTPVRVLLVDDQPVYHDLVVRLLERDPDITVVGVAHTIERALALVRTRRPQVVVRTSSCPTVTAPTRRGASREVSATRES